MRLKIRFLCFFFFTLIFGFLFTKSALAANFNLSGQITNGSSVAVSGASIDIFNTGTTTDVVPPVISDNSGNYTISVPSGTYDIKVTQPSSNNLSPAIAPSYTISSDKVINFILLPAGSTSLTGHVYGPLGNALPNQTVQLFTSDNSTLVVSTTTDASGNYSLQTSPGNYFLWIRGNNNDPSLSAPQHYNVYGRIGLDENTVIDFTIPAKKVDLHLQDSTGNPVSGVGMEVYSNNGLASELANTNGLSIGGGVVASGGSGVGLSVLGLPKPLTDSAGNVSVWLIPNNVDWNYNFIAHAPNGYGSTTLSGIVITDNTQRTIILIPFVSLTGHVYGPLGNLLTGQTVQLLDSNNAVVVSTTTDASGSYSLQTSPGSYQFWISGFNNSLSLNAPQHYNVHSGIGLNQNTVIDVTIPAKKVDIRVQDSVGNPVSGVGMEIYSGGLASEDSNGNGLSIGGGLTASGGSGAGLSVFGLAKPLTDSSGNVSVWLIPTNSYFSYTFKAYAPTGSIYNNVSPDGILVTDNTQKTIILPYNHAAPVSVATLSPNSVAPDQYTNPVSVTLSAIAASGYTVANTYYTVDGGSQQTYSSSFTITGLGSHVITYWSADNSGATETTNSKSFTIVDTANLAGTVFIDTNQNGVQDPGETGFSGATLTLNTGKTLTTDTNGNYTFLNIPTGSYVETLTLPNGYIATTTNPTTVVVSANTTQNFGIYSQPVVGVITPSTTAPVQVNTSVSASTTFTDGDSTGTHIAQWNWGDGSTSTGVVTEPNDVTPGSITGSHTYATTGSFIVILKVTDIGKNVSGYSSQTVIAIIPATGLTGSNLAGNNYDGANLSGQNLTGSNLKATSFNLVNLMNANLTGVNIKNASLKGANLTGADLTNSNLRGVDLTNANLTNANLTGANLTGAIITGVIWSNTTCPNGTNSSNDNNTCVGQGGGL